MSNAEIVLTIVTTIVGAIIGWFTQYYYFRRGGAARSALVIGLTEVARLDPSTVGVKVEMKIGTLRVDNVVVLDLTVAAQGHADLDVEDAEDPTRWARRPKIVLPEGLRSIADPWNPAGAAADADVRVARQLTDDSRQAFHIHVHALSSGSTVVARLLCSYRDAHPATLSSRDLTFTPGFVPGVDIRPAGLLKGASGGS